VQLILTLWLPLSSHLSAGVGTLQVCQQNFVCNLEVLPSSLPAAGSAAGSQLQLLVAVHTEDQQPLPWDVLSSSLTLSLAPPNGPSAEAGEAAAGGKGGKGKSSSRKADVIQLTPERVWDGDAEGMEPAVAEAAAAAAQQGCVVCFSTPQLTLAGLYTMTAEYVEGRAELLPALPKQVSAAAIFLLHQPICDVDLAIQIQAGDSRSYRQELRQEGLPVLAHMCTIAMLLCRCRSKHCAAHRCSLSWLLGQSALLRCRQQALTRTP
jgi:hypothetical protein